MLASIRQCEAEVEAARSKLARDLTTLREPDTLQSFTEGIKQDALETKDELVQAAQSKLSGFVDEIKAKAAANPAATLAIGAGIAWRLLRNPPISTALIGAGLFSLWRTQGFQPGAPERSDYLQAGKERLKEQAGEFATQAKTAMGDAVAAISAKTDEMTGAMASTATEWASEVRDNVSETGAALADAVSSAAKDNVRRLSNVAHHSTTRLVDESRRQLHDARDAGAHLIEQTGGRDALLLGVAGIAVAAALGIAYQKRFSEEMEKT